MTENFSGNSLLYTYYRYLDRFHVKPEKCSDLFEFLEYEKTTDKVKICTSDYFKSLSGDK